MEITLEAIISFIGLFLGSGTGLFAWKYVRRKSKAEAEQTEAQALKEKQDYYQQIINDVVKDRDYYKSDRDEYRQKVKQYDERMNAQERSIARLGRIVEGMRPFMCADLGCKLRKRVVLSAEGTPEQLTKPAEKTDIEPIDSEAL